jgi:hypothetical protein
LSFVLSISQKEASPFIGLDFKAVLFLIMINLIKSWIFHLSFQWFSFNSKISTFVFPLENAVFFIHSSSLLILLLSPFFFWILETTDSHQTFTLLVLLTIKMLFFLLNLFLYILSCTSLISSFSFLFLNWILAIPFHPSHSVFQVHFWWHLPYILSI